MAWWIWLLGGLSLFLVELLTPGGFYFLFFGISATALGLLAGLGVAGPLWVQWLLFSLISVVTLMLFRRPLLEKTRAADHGDKIDSFIGERALVVEAMATGAFGKVEMRGSIWNARNVGSSELIQGERCVVQSLEGLTLRVGKEQSQS